MSPTSYTPPPVGVLDFVGRAGVVVEVAPNHYVEIILEIRHGDPGDLAQLNTEAQVDTVWDGPFMPHYIHLGTRADIHLIGRIVSREEAERPRWAQDTPEIEARKEITP